jgi:hypothetical protein
MAITTKTIPRLHDGISSFDQLSISVPLNVVNICYSRWHRRLAILCGRFA